MGGLSTFHRANIPSYANSRTIELAAKKGEFLPQHSFRNSLDLWTADIVTHTKFFGKAHTFPGHGKPGNLDLLDYTIDLFQ